MIKILLADDDILALNRITSMIPWNDYNFELIGKAISGTDCLRQVNELHPDILILDIDMPDKNGVEVTAALVDYPYPLQILILSSYDNFTFVRDTLKHGAYDYLLKHQINSNILLQKLLEMKKQLEKDGVRSSELSQLTTIAKQHYLKSFLTGHFNANEVWQHLYLNQSGTSLSYVLVAMQINNFIVLTHFSPSLQKPKLIDAILTISTNVFSALGNGILCHMDHGQFAILFHFPAQCSSKIIQDYVSSYMHTLLNNIYKVLSLKAIYQISDIITDFASIPAQHKKVIALLEKKPFTNNPPEESLPVNNNSISIAQEKELVNALLTGNLAQIDTILTDLFRRYETDQKKIPQPIMYQILQIGERFERQQRQENYTIRQSTPPAGTLTELSGSKLMELIKEYFYELVTNIVTTSTDQFSHHVQNALQYIRKNYNKDINLNTASDYIHLSPSHLSRIFKKETGSSFTEYLVSYRIEIARQLLKDGNMDLKEIAEKVGFNSYNYFLRVYKEKTGNTPTQDMQRNYH
ncbi:MAG: helix-turn-helix domain-containing protein [Clostridiales bacterium]|nr:helix-turn-helix domain-containing protein [Clostridiales bacterium]